MIFPSICLVTAFVMSTWFEDNLAVALYLWICGPPWSGKTTLLRLHCLCRGAALIAGTTPSAVYSLPALLRPTLLLDELRFNDTQHSYALDSWLRAGNARGVPVTVGGQLVDKGSLFPTTGLRYSPCQPRFAHLDGPNAQELTAS